MSAIALATAFVLLIAAVLASVESRREGTSPRLVLWMFVGWAVFGWCALVVIVAFTALAHWVLS